MAKVSLSTIKSWFQTSLIPTQAQFWDTWDSFLHKDDAIAIDQVTGLDDILNTIPTPEDISAVLDFAPTIVTVSGANTYTLQAGKLLEKVALDIATTGNFKIGTTVGGAEIYEDSVTDGDALLWQLDYYNGSEQTIHFTGTGTVKIYAR